jgi:uncharacterized repeat protein (TIGR01451 family)/uncharacterized delta-60 repeat protein
MAFCFGSALQSQAQVPPPNDNLASAQALVGAVGTVTGTNLYATAQPGEPAPYPGNPAQCSIWYLWTAPFTTTIDFNTRGSTDPYGNQLDTVLAVYRLTSGTNVAFTNLTLVAQNDDDPSGGVVSRVDFRATLETMYLIQVDGSVKYTGTGTNAQGYILLNWGNSLVAGGFGFSAQTFPIGSADDYIVDNFNGVLNPSLRNEQVNGAPNARITVTRRGGYTGRCEVQMNFVAGLYTNIYETNYYITNIFITNYSAAGLPTSFTNVMMTNTVAINNFQDNYYGTYMYLPLDFDAFQAWTNNNGTILPPFSTNLPLGTYGLPQFFTNFPCPAPPIPNSGTTVNSDGSSVYGITNVLCLSVVTNVIVPAAINGVHYTALSTNLTFDDFQMSQDVYVQINPYLNTISLPAGDEILDYDTPGPEDSIIAREYPGLVDRNYTYAGLNANVFVTLTNAVLDPQENPDILAPTISQSAAAVDVLNYWGSPTPGYTNNPNLVYINFERQTYRVNKDAGVAVLWVQRTVRGAGASHVVNYTIDSAHTGLTVIDYNTWAAVAGADYAAPSNRVDQPVFDFRLPTNTDWNGIYGTLTFPQDILNAQPIYIPIETNGAAEFDQDILVQLFLTTGNAQADASATPPATLGNIINAHLTINFDNTAANIQPGGAVDRTYNVDNVNNSYPPNNQIPGTPSGQVNAVAIQQDGLAVIGGEFTDYDTYSLNYMARVQTNGFLDPNFSGLGSGPDNYVNAVAIDAVGRILIGGNFSSVNGTNASHIARLNNDGSLDASFVTGYGFSGNVRALAVDASGNILVGGDFTSFNTTNCNHIARLLPSGGLDPSFLPSSGAPGSGANQTVRTVAIDNNNNVVLGGDFTQVNGTNWNRLARLLPSGALDRSFNPGTGADGSIFSLAVQPNNAIIIGGIFQNFNLTARSGIARATASGASDTTFDPGTGVNDAVYSVLVQPDGKILVGGQFTSFNTTRRIGVARLLPQGWIDTSFMDTSYNQFAGIINHYYNTNAYDPGDFPAYSNFRNSILAMGLEPTGNVIVGGSFSRVGGGFTRDDVRVRMNVARLIGQPTPGPELGGLGNCPGNITLTQNPYTVDDFAKQLYVTLQRVNGSLGPATLTLGTNTSEPGPGAASRADFGLSTATATYGDIWNNWFIYPVPSYGWRVADGYYGFNNNIQSLNDFGASTLYLSIHNDLAASQNLFAGLSLLNLNAYGLMTLGGQPIPLFPALGQYGAKLEIINDNFPPGVLGFGATNYTVTDTGGFVTISVLRTNGSAGVATVQFSTQQGFTNGTGTNVATPGNDFISTNGTLNFQGGQTSNGFTVQIRDHNNLVPTKYFNVVLTAPTVAGFDTNVPPVLQTTAVVEIIDGNFLPGHLAFSLPAYSVLKGTPSTVTVNRIGGANGVLMVQCGTSDGTATNGINYTGVTNLLTFGNGSITPQTMTIQTLDDKQVEGDKLVNISLFGATNQGVANSLSNNEIIAFPSNVVLTIHDIDSYGSFNFSAPNFNILQNAGQALITVIRTGGTVGSVSVNFATFNGTNATAPYQTALAGTNYGATNGVLSFGPGVTSQSFIVPIYYTPAETNAANRLVNLVLFGGSPAGVSNQFPKTATLTILDNQLVLSPAGSVDQTTANGAGFNDYVVSLALQPNGDILAGGNFTFFNQFPFNFVGRLNPDGSYDNTFLFSQAGANSNVNQVLSQTPSGNQTNGNIMIVGGFSQVDEVNRSGICRLNLDGSLDETFNPGGGADGAVYAIAQYGTNLASVSNYYVIGGAFANYYGTSSSGVARLTPAGTLDPNFSVGAGASSSNRTVRVVAIDANNNILVGGDFTSFNNVPHHYLVRLNVSGSVDSNFVAFDGIHADINGSVRAIQIQPDSRILIGGSFTAVNGSNYNYIARLNNDGTLDTSFNVGAGCDNSVLAITLDSQNRILLGGVFTHASGVTRNGITRLNPDGTVDPTINFGFGANGFVDTIVIQPNDEIDVGGGFTTFNNIPENNFVRLYGGAISGDGSIQFSQGTYGVLENGTNATISIQRIGGEGTAAQPTVSAVFSTADGTAVNGKDYIGVTNTVTFPLGETFRAVTVPIINGTAVGGDPTVNLNLSDSVYAAIGPQTSAQLIITNVNTAVAFSAGSYGQSANASSGVAAIPVVRLGNSNNTVAVTVYTGSNGTATPYVNFVPVTNTLTFYPGTLTNYFLVPILNSPTMYSDMTVDLEMNDASNAIVGAPSSALLTIGAVVNGPGVLAFSQTNYTVSEGATNALITIIRTNGNLGNVSVTLTTSNGTAVAGVNYGSVNTLVQFSGGVNSNTVEIPIYQLTNAGPDTTVLLTLSNPQNGATIGGLTQETLTIQNDIASFSFVKSSYLVGEGDGAVTIFILRAGLTNSSATVGYTTYSPANANDTNGFAVPNVDYIPASGTLTFVPGETLQTIPITILQGHAVNGLETFQVLLQNPSPGFQIGAPGTTSVGIESDVSGFALSTNAYYVGENGSNIVITVTRLNPNTGSNSVQFATSDGTATHGVDYLATSGVLNFLDGQASSFFVVTILNPNVVESNKTFNVTLSSPSTNSYLVSPTNAVVTITNVYTGVAFGSASFTISECGVAATIPVVRTGLTNSAVSVDFATSDGSGVAGTNYFATNATLNFQPGQTVASFSVQVINNHVIGPDHTVNLNLSNPLGTQLLNPSTALLTIQECNGAFIVKSGTSFQTGSILPGTGVVYPNDTVTISFGLRDIAGGGTTNLVATMLATNGVTNVVAPATYGKLDQNGPTVARPFTFTAIGTNGQNITATMSLQDGTANLGQVAFGFTLGGFVTSLTNSEPITILDSANPPTRATNAFAPGFGYPSIITAAGIPGVVTKVTVTLANFGHQFPHDVDTLLSSPGGQSSVLMSKCGLGFSVSNVTLTFDQSAGGYVPLTNAITNGTYLPTTNSANVMAELPTVPLGEQGVPPAPIAPYSANLSAFVGGQANGTWALWIVDTVTLDSGVISNGWILNISSGAAVEADSDLELAVSPTPIAATISNVLTYAITVTNFGPSPATNVVLNDTLPAGVIYVTNTCNCATSTNGGLTFTLPTLAVGAGAAFNVVVMPTNLGYITNIVTALANQPDPNSNNVVATLSLVGPPSADLGVNMYGSPNPALAGGDVTYIITVTNGGPSTATDVTATDVLPAGFALLSMSASTGTSTNSSGTITWNIGDLIASPGGTGPTLTLVTKPMLAEIGLNQVTVGSSVYDPSKLNNYAAVKIEVDEFSVVGSGTNYSLTWPAAFTNYVLQGAVVLQQQNTSWTTITPAPPVTNGQYVYTLPGTSGYHFFQLKAPLP